MAELYKILSVFAVYRHCRIQLSVVLNSVTKKAHSPAYKFQLALEADFRLNGWV